MDTNTFDEDRLARRPSAASGRPPTNFDELQDAIDAGRAPVGDPRLTRASADEAVASQLHEDSREGLTEVAPDTVVGHATLPAAPASTGMPFIGRKPLAAQRRILLPMLGLGLVGLLAAALLAIANSNRSAAQVAAVGQAQTQSQRLAKAATLAVDGQIAAFGEAKVAAAALSSRIRALRDGSADIAQAPADVRPAIDAVIPALERTEQAAATLVAQQAAVAAAPAARLQMRERAGRLVAAAESLEALKPPPAVAGRMGEATMAGGSALPVAGAAAVVDSFNALRTDFATLGNQIAVLMDGDTAEDVAPLPEGPLRAAVQPLRDQHTGLAPLVAALANPATGAGAARAAQAVLVREAEPLRESLEVVQHELAGAATGGGFGGPNLLLLLGALVLTGFAVWGLLRVLVVEQAQRAELAETQRRDAERQQQEARQVNDANQQAILRLMNELQAVAEGDLTQQATVTEDITGAIADSVNYTVEELRTLVTQVHGTAARVNDTTRKVEDTSTELLAASEEQLREIRDTGESVLRMAARINDVSAQAQRSAEVAGQSLQAAHGGFTAVQDAIGGMNAIRDQIQDTSKRIKRLGESSQEIGEITELISDITEQTNVLALNAAIQAASAGEAGRGFSVVASEVQRLAERSADATRQIAALVKTIQGDTQDAVAAMARSTQGVVEGARLSDNAGAALADIDRVTRRLAELIAQISQQASSEARLANDLAVNIQHIFAVTEQTGEGTRSTSQMVRELSRSAHELRDSVARFKIS